MANTVSTRDNALDALRGLTIALMLIVNNAGDFKTVWLPLKHAQWHGFLGADIVFPLFLFISGFAAHLSVKKFKSKYGQSAQNATLLMRHVFIRTLILFGLGLFLNAWPFSFLPGTEFSWENLRVFGVLQRIAFCYFLGSLILWFTEKSYARTAAAFFLIAVYETGMRAIKINYGGYAFGQSFELTDNFARLIDILILPESHLYKIQGVAFDPEGLFPVVTAAATFLLGAIYAQVQKKGILLSVLAVLAITSMQLEPINKNLWTTSFTLRAAALSVLLYVFFKILYDKNWASKLHIFEIAGRNPLVIYVFTTALAKTLAFAKISETKTVKQTVYENLFSSWLPAELASFAYACVILSVGLLLGYALYRQKKILKV